jgi:ech hydrogenase subunit B
MVMVDVLLIILAPFIGGLLYGFERIVKARMQNRKGPPLLQPFYDMAKLMQKRIFIIHPLHAILGVLYCLSLWAVVGFLIVGGNLLYIIFLHLLSTLLIILAGFSVKSVYSHIGSNRELLALLAYEPIFICMAAGFYLINGSFDTHVIFNTPSQIGVLFLLFLAFLLTIPIKLKKLPFDAVHAHQEIVGGVDIEYSGIFYEFVYMARFLEYVFVFLLLFLFAGNSLWLTIFLGIVVFIGMNVIDNATARVNMPQMIKRVLSIALVLCILNLIGLVYV